MTADTAEPTLPRYAQSSLDALSTSVLASLAVPGEPNPLGLEAAERVCLLVIDGLGWELLRAHQAAAQFMSELAATATPLTAGFPATTATSLGTLGTGRPPGQHGLLGYQVAVPERGTLLNALSWDRRVDPYQWQPGSTMFERAAEAGVKVVRVAAGALRASGLSAAALRGADFVAADTLGALVSRAAAALAADPPVLALVYYGHLDGTGHAIGCSSDAWKYELAHVDKLAEQLAEALPRGTALHITADHGMVDVPPGERIDADALPELRDGVTLLGGEPRARHVYCKSGAAGDVLATWVAVLGDRAWVVSREQAVADGWFGPVDARCSARIGDVVAAPCGSWAVVATKAEPRESALVGMHGSLTLSDQLVPLLTLTTG
jgi:predicted AlkP superfamily pyrophosphatase or phosphodiesterase